jgi:hypothetical protein
MWNVGVNDERARSGLCHFPDSDTLSEEEKILEQNEHQNQFQKRIFKKTEFTV